MSVGSLSRAREYSICIQYKGRTTIFPETRASQNHKHSGSSDWKRPIEGRLWTPSQNLYGALRRSCGRLGALLHRPGARSPPTLLDALSAIDPKWALSVATSFGHYLAWRKCRWYGRSL